MLKNVKCTVMETNKFINSYHTIGTTFQVSEILPARHSQTLIVEN